MKKILTLFAASGVITACAGTKSGSATKTASSCPTQPVEITKDSSLKSVKLITDGGSVEDKSFNNGIWDGVRKYAGDSSDNYVVPTGTNTKDLQTIYKKTLSNTQLLVLGGYQHSDALANLCSSIGKNKGIVFLDGVVKSGNINSVIFKTEEAAFYAGYLAAKYLSDNKSTYDTKASAGLKIGAYGGMNLKPVTAFMGGFQQGVALWNSNVKDGQSKVEFMKLGSSAESYFSGNFKPGTGKAISEKLVNNGADIILPVAGPQTLDTLKVIKEKGAKTLVVGVDNDQSAKYAEYSSYFFTSIMKKLDTAAYKAIRSILGDESDKDYGLGKTTIGTMSNDLIGLATSGSNKLTNSEYLTAKDDSKISAAAKKATDTFKA